eukprot:153993_1
MSPTTPPTIIYVDASNPSQLQDGTSWITSFNSLQTALSVATNGDQIWIGQGYYYPTHDTNRTISFSITQSLLKMYGGFYGNETSFEQRNMYNPLPQTILSGNIGDKSIQTDNSDVVLWLMASNDVLLDGLQISDAYAIDPSTSSFKIATGLGIINSHNGQINNCTFNDNIGYFSGGVSVWNSNNLAINNCKFDNNVGYFGGGGIFIRSSHNVSVNMCHFSDNSASGDPGFNVFQAGGAINIYESNNNLIYASTFYSNSANDAGSAIYTHNNSYMLVSDCEINNNIIYYNEDDYDDGDGGAINGKLQYKFQIQYSDLINNTGGAIILQNTDNSFIINNEFSGNAAFIKGGAMYLYDTSRILILKNKFYSNNAIYGGALNIHRCDYIIIRACIFIENTVVANNESSVTIGSTTIGSTTHTWWQLLAYGGAVYANDTTRLGIDNSTFTDNSALAGTTIDSQVPTISAYGGAIYATFIHTMPIYNTTFSHNKAIALPDDWVNADPNSAGGAFYGHSTYYLKIIDCLFDANIANHETNIDRGSAYGGAIYAGYNYPGYNYAGLVIESNQFLRNEASTCQRPDDRVNTYPNRPYCGGSSIYTDYCDGCILNENHFTANTYRSVVLIRDSHDMIIQNSEFTANSRYGGCIDISNSDNCTIINNQFTNNNISAILMHSTYFTEIKSNIFSSNAVETSGAAIDTRVDYDMTINNNTFKNNSARSGGAVFIIRGNSTVNNNQFLGNIAEYGAAMYIDANDAEIVDTQFSYNFATYGGAIYGSNTGTTYIHGGMLFSDNEAYFGGAIYMEGSGYTSISETHFSNNTGFNSGSALYIIDNSQRLLIMECKIIHNSARSASIYLELQSHIELSELICSENDGGCIELLKLYDNNAGFTVQNSVFSNNKASVSGGGMRIVSNNKLTFLIRNATFDGNQAPIGGAISISDHRVACMDTSTSIIETTAFTNNKANIGGAFYINSDCWSMNLSTIYFEANSAENGGALAINISSDTSQNITNTIFRENKAEYNGGAILIYHASNVLMTDSQLSSNYAPTGGAITVLTNSLLSLESSMFVNNNATNGGSIYIERTSAITMDSVKILRNIASNNGGGLNMRGTECNIFNSTFNNNQARNHGGCISFENEKANISVTETIFKNCGYTTIFGVGNGLGGAIYSATPNINFNAVSFHENNALEGGATYFEDTCPIQHMSDNNVFTSNNANYGGGAMIINK